MKRFILDTFLCSAFIFGLMGLFASVTFFRVFDLFDPIGEMFSDFELTDIVFSQLRDDPTADENIVVVNIGNLSREGIANQLEILQQFEPAVVGIDIMLDAEKPWEEDSALVRVLSQYDNVVVGQDLRDFNIETNQWDRVVRPNEHYDGIVEHGFVDLITDARNQNDLKMCRSFAPREFVGGNAEYAFSVKLAYAKDSLKTQKFIDRGNSEEIINYKGNVFSFEASRYGMKYFVIDVYDIFEGNFAPEIIQGNIVIMCYLGAYLGDTNTKDDLYFTPLNENYVGKAEHDMFGGVVHANIISMIMDEDYIDEMPQTWGIILAILMCLINVFVFKIIYGGLPKWYDGITKVIQLIELAGFSFLMIILFDDFNYKADFTLMLIVIALSGDSIEIYHGVVKNLFSPQRRREVFKVNKRFWESQSRT